MKLDDEYFRKKATEYVSYFADDMSSEQINGLYLLLKEVSRDTRHACSKVRVGCPYDTPGDAKAWFQGQEEHADACMNVGEE